MLTPFIESEIKKHSLEFPKEEVCGFVLDNNTIFRARNISSLKNKTFSVYPLDYLAAEEKGKIVAVYHSHILTKEFSEFDKVNSTNHNKIYVMYCLKSDSFHIFYPNNYSNKYIGRQFNYKTNNCYTIIKDFYKNELNINIEANIPELNEDWYKNNPNLILDEFNKSTQFKSISNWQQNIKKYDIIFFNYLNIDNSPHHLGMYIDDGIFLHLPRRQYSKMEIFDNFFQSKVFDVIRYVGF